MRRAIVRVKAGDIKTPNEDPIDRLIAENFHETKKFEQPLKEAGMTRAAVWLKLSLDGYYKRLVRLGLPRMDR
jgi:hypothetical protein